MNKRKAIDESKVSLAEGVMQKLPGLDVEVSEPALKEIRFIDESQTRPHGFGRKVTITKNGSFFDKGQCMQHKDIVIPLGVLTYVSFEYKLEEIRAEFKKAYSCVNDVIIDDNGAVFAQIDIVSETKSPVRILDENTAKTYDEIMDIKNIPTAIRHMVMKCLDPIYYKDGQTYVRLAPEIFLLEVKVVDLMTPVSVSVPVHITEKAKIREYRKSILAKQEKEFVEVLQISKPIVTNDRVSFSIEVDADPNTELSISVNTRHLVALNASMSIEKYIELADKQVNLLREGGRVSFVQTASIINKDTQTLVVPSHIKGGVQPIVLRNPIIYLDRDETSIPLFTKTEVPAFLAVIGAESVSKINDEAVKKIYGDIIPSKPVYFSDDKRGDVFLCPSFKLLSLLVLTGETKIPVNANVISNTRDVAIALSINI